MEQREAPPLDLRGDATRLLARLARSRRARMARLTTLTVINALVVLAQPLVVGFLINDGLIGESSTALLGWSSALAGLSVASGLTAAARTFLSLRLGNDINDQLRRELYESTGRLDLPFFAAAPNGALTTRIVLDSVGPGSLLSGLYVSSVASVVSAVGAVVAMLLLDWRLTLVVPLVAIVALPTRLAARAQGRRSERMFAARQRLCDFLTERTSLDAVLLARTLGIETGSNELRDRSQELSAAQQAVGRLSSGFGIAFGFGVGLTSALLFFVGGRFVLNGSLSVGALVAFSLYVARLQEPVGALSQVRIGVGEAMVSVGRILEIQGFAEGRPSAVSADVITSSARRDQPAIEIHDVSYRYPAAAEAVPPSLLGSIHAADSRASSVPSVQAPSLKLTQGDIAAVVGPSGSGKSTLAMLAAGLLRPDRGTVRLHGRDPFAVSPGNRRALVGVVSQNAHFFAGSIRDNLLLARPDATDRDLVAACRAARIHDRIRSMPRGYSAHVGAQGGRLSGGERQRLSIARLLLQDPLVAVFDEATAHLDRDSEDLVIGALREGLAGRTALIISHRPAALSLATKLVAVRDGVVDPAIERAAHTGEREWPYVVVG